MQIKTITLKLSAVSLGALFFSGCLGTSFLAWIMLKCIILQTILKAVLVLQGLKER